MAVNDTINRLINQLPCSNNPILRAIDPTEVQAIIDFGHIHLYQAFPQVPTYGKSGMVATPDGKMHNVHIKADGGSANDNDICCWSCWPAICPAVVAAFIIELVIWLDSQNSGQRQVCPDCGIPFNGQPIPYETDDNISREELGL